MATKEEIEGQVKDTFDRLKSAYDKSWDPKSHTLHVGLFTDDNENLATAFRNSNIYLRGLIERYVPLNPNSRVLDVCTGTGRTLLELTQEYGCSGVGVDISEEQIRDARANNNGKCRFIVGSASELSDYLPEGGFTHVVSQDGIFLAYDKERCLQEIYDCLDSGGIFVFSDFLAEVSKEEMEARRRFGVYKTVKWERGTSHDDYVAILNDIGFTVIHSEQRGEDMIKTYEKLIPQTKRLLAGDLETCDKLVSRYQSIVDSVRDGELDWGWFVAKK
tara:strand:+ start:1360 stop:2184 length:825 start_codon:yes stop_codon:yes gene_type:complete